MAATCFMGLVTASGSALLAASSVTLVPRGTEWSYRLAEPRQTLYDDEAEETDPARFAWIGPEFDEAWNTGLAGSGLTEASEDGQTGRGGARRRAYQFRRTFELTSKQLSRIRGLELEVTRGAGVAVFLNGAELYRMAAPYDHTLVAEGLEPDTTYYYAVESEEGWLVAPSPERWFHTHPAAGRESPTRIWVVGDIGRAHFGGSAAVRDAYAAFTRGRRTDVWLTLGDNAYDDGRFEEFQNALFDVYPALLSHTFLWPSIGNHDKRAFESPSNGPYLELFDLPAHGESGGVPSTVEHFYSFDYGNIHFVVLDSEVASMEHDSPQIEWLRRDLENNRAEWTIATIHIPPYSKGAHDSDGKRRHFVVRGVIVPILEEYGVDLMLAGHSHSYERSHFIRGHYGTADSWNGAVHLVDGGDGCPADAFRALCRVGADGAYVGRGTVYAVVGCSSVVTQGGNLDHPAMVHSERSLGSMVIDVDGDRLDARFLEVDGTIGDRFVIRHPRARAASKPVASPSG